MHEVHVTLHEIPYKHITGPDSRDFFTALRRALATTIGVDPTDDDHSMIELYVHMLDARSQNCPALSIDIILPPSLVDRHQRVHDILARVCTDFIWNRGNSGHPLVYTGLARRFKLHAKFGTAGSHHQVYEVPESDEKSDESIKTGSAMIDFPPKDSNTIMVEKFG